MILKEDCDVAFVGREEIYEIKRSRKSFLKSSGKIAQRSKAIRCENGACSRPGQSPIDLLVDRCARGAQTWPG